MGKYTFIFWYVVQPWAWELANVAYFFGGPSLSLSSCLSWFLSALIWYVSLVFGCLYSFHMFLYSRYNTTFLETSASLAYIFGWFLPFLCLLFFNLYRPFFLFLFLYVFLFLLPGIIFVSSFAPHHPSKTRRNLNMSISCISVSHHRFCRDRGWWCINNW